MEVDRTSKGFWKKCSLDAQGKEEASKWTPAKKNQGNSRWYWWKCLQFQLGPIGLFLGGLAQLKHMMEKDVHCVFFKSWIIALNTKTLGPWPVRFRKSRQMQSKAKRLKDQQDTQGSLHIRQRHPCSFTLFQIWNLGFEPFLGDTESQ